ncbi:MAG TPA: transposase [Gaiellaceae bacterium]|nr:transposase [Gaiellaceae bacterium]
MPRPLRDQSAGVVHLTWRGNRRQAVFLDELDRERFCELLGVACERYGWRVLAWCLLGNHLHLLVEVPAETLSRGMQWLGGRYAQFFNVRHELDGHLFQGRFHSERVADLEHAIEAGRYVDLNPERAGICRADEWRWSSARAHLGLEPPRPFHDAGWLVGHFAFEPADRAAAYADYLDQGRLRPRRPRTAPRLSPRHTSRADMAVPAMSAAPSAPDMALRAMSRGLTPGHGRDGHGPEAARPP